MLELMTRYNIKITVWRDTKVTCRATIMEDFKNIIMFDYAVYQNFKENKQSGTFVYMPTGSKIVFEGADSVGKVLGGAQDISFFNEVTEFSKPVYLQITQRTSGKVICDYNPSKDFWLEKYRSDNASVFIHSTFRDNAFCPTNIVEQLLSYEPWETGTYEIVDSEVCYKGKPISDNNQPPPHLYNIQRGTADAYMWLVYGLGIGSEKPFRIYKGWKTMSQEAFDSLDYTSYYGLDFGAKNPTAMVEVKFNGDDTFYVCPRLYTPISDMKHSLNSAVTDAAPHMRKGSDMIICDSAKESYINQLKADGHFAIGAIKGSGSVQAGIGVVQHFNIVYVRNDEFEDEYINYSWKVDRYEKATDEPLKEKDHYLDAVRYVIDYVVKLLGIRI